MTNDHQGGCRSAPPGTPIPNRKERENGRTSIENVENLTGFPPFQHYYHIENVENSKSLPHFQHGLAMETVENSTSFQPFPQHYYVMSCNLGRRRDHSIPKKGIFLKTHMIRRYVKIEASTVITSPKSNKR